MGLKIADYTRNPKNKLSEYDQQQLLTFYERQTSKDVKHGFECALLVLGFEIVKSYDVSKGGNQDVPNRSEG